MKKTAVQMHAMLWVSLIAIGCNTPTDPKTPEYWIYRLDDAKEQNDAVRKLGELKDPKAVEPLIKVMKENEKLRPDAAQSLGMIGDARAIPALMAMVTVDPGGGQDEATRAKIKTNERAINALSDLKAKEAADLVLQVHQKARDLPVRMATMRAMGVIRDPKFGPVMIEGLEQDDNMFTKKIAAEMVGDLHTVSAVPALILALYVQKGGTSVYPQAAFSLFQIGEPAIAPLIATLEGKNEKVEKLAQEKTFVEGAIAIKAIEVLGDLAAKQAEPQILAAWNVKNEDTRPFVRRAIALAAGRMGSSKSVAHLSAALDEPSGELRAFYTEALNELSDRTALPALLKASKTGVIDSAKKVSFVAYTRLGDGRELAAATAMAKGTADFQPELARLVAAKECAATVACWVGKLKDKDAKVRDRAAYELGRLGDKSAAAPLLAAIKDSNLETRYAIIWALRKVGSKDQVDALKAISASEKGLPTHRGKDDMKKLIVDLAR